MGGGHPHRPEKADCGQEHCPERITPIDSVSLPRPTTSPDLPPIITMNDLAGHRFVGSIDVLLYDQQLRFLGRIFPGPAHFLSQFDQHRPDAGSQGWRGDRGPPPLHGPYRARPGLRTPAGVYRARILAPGQSRLTPAGAGAGHHRLYRRPDRGQHRTLPHPARYPPPSA